MQILVAIKAAGVNPVDVRLSSGKFHSFKPPLPYIPGIDGAGIVESIGSEVTTFKVKNQTLNFSRSLFIIYLNLVK